MAFSAEIIRSMPFKAPSIEKNPENSLVEKIEDYRTYLGSFFVHKFNPAIGNAKDLQKAKELKESRIKLFENVDKTRKDLQERIQFFSSDGFLLDGILYRGKEKGVILFVLDNGGYYEKMADPTQNSTQMVEFFKQEVGDINVCIVNTRSISESQGYLLSLKDQDMDICSTLEYLTSDNMFGKDMPIVVYAHSLGALHGINGAALFEEHSPDSQIHIVADRAAFDLSTSVYDRLGRSKLGSIAWGLIHLLNQNHNNLKAWETLKGKKLIIVSEKDEVIPFETSSLCKAVLKPDLPRSRLRVVNLDTTCTQAHHTRIFTPSEKKVIAKEIKQMLGLSYANSNFRSTTMKIGSII